VREVPAVAAVDFHRSARCSRRSAGVVTERRNAKADFGSIAARV
jgi:hypothetical protein